MTTPDESPIMKPINISDRGTMFMTAPNEGPFIRTTGKRMWQGLAIIVGVMAVGAAIAVPNWHNFAKNPPPVSAIATGSPTARRLAVALHLRLLLQPCRVLPPLVSQSGQVSKEILILFQTALQYLWATRLSG